MVNKLILLSGRVCSGKSTIAKLLAQKVDARVISTRELLEARGKGIDRSREAMQAFGEKLDTKTKGAWLRDDLAPELENSTEDILIVDSVRALSQVNAIRSSYRRILLHIHLDSSDETLKCRYLNRISSGKTDVREFDTYEEVLRNETEQKVPELASEADINVWTDRCLPADVVTRIAVCSGLCGRMSGTVDVVVGAQYGSEGKGQICQHIAHEYDLLIRVGGPNAGHTVYEEPRPYKFRQLPSGTRAAPEARLLIGAGASIDLEVLLREISECGVEAERLTIDPHAIIIEEKDKVKERKTVEGSIGSTAQGVGQAAIRRIDGRYGKKPQFAKDSKLLAPFVGNGVEAMADILRSHSHALLEGTQGSGLSLYHGEYPYVTSRETNCAGCLAETGLSPKAVRKIVLVARTYPIRVESPQGGTSGSLSQEIEWEEVAQRSEIPLADIQRAEKTTTTNRKRRVGEFDWNLLYHSTLLNQPTDLALTFVDYLSIRNRSARRFEQLQSKTIEFIEEVERVCQAPVSLISTRFHNRAIIDRRSWKR